MNNLITKLRWLIKESRKTGQNSISCGKVEEYIAEYEVTQDIINNKDGGKYAKDSVVDFIIDID